MHFVVIICIEKVQEGVTGYVKIIKGVTNRRRLISTALEGTALLLNAAFSKWPARQNTCPTLR